VVCASVCTAIPGCHLQGELLGKQTCPALLPHRPLLRASSVVWCVFSILGKVGGVPALGGMKLPVLPRDQVLRATGGTAAREIHYSKMEGRDAP
jgi:hypothetical protein